MATVDSIKVLAYQKEYIKMSDKYVDTPASVFVAGSGNYSIMAANDSDDMVASGTYSYAEGYNTQAIGIGSHAEGGGSVAVGESSHSEGSQSIASGNFSHAEGLDSKAVGETSHSEGYHSMAIGTSSHAEGKGLHDFVNLTGNNGTYSFPKWYINFKKRQALYDINNDNYTIITSVDQTNHTLTTLDSLGELNNSLFEVYSNYVLGDSSHTEGSSNAVLSKAAHAEGSENMVSGNFSHVEGMGNTVSGQVSHAEGSYTIASGANQHVAGRYNVEDLNNTYAEIIGIGATDTARKNGRTLDWSGNAWYAGTVSAGTVANPALVTNANDLATKAYVDSHVSGSGSSSSPVESGTGAGSVQSKAYVIDGTTYAQNASGNGATAIGENTVAKGEASSARGINTYAPGKGSSAEGLGNIVTIDVTCDAGSSNATYTDEFSTAFPTGEKTAYILDPSDSTMYFVTSINRNKHTFVMVPAPESAMSNKTMVVMIHCAYGVGSHTEGCETWVTGAYSHAEGYNTKVDGDAAHAEGHGTKASGGYSHVEGWNCTAASNMQHVQGKYNIVDSNDTYAHIVGNGTTSKRSNAHTLDWSGNAWYAGNLTVNGGSITLHDETGDVTITAAQLRSLLATL